MVQNGFIDFNLVFLSPSIVIFIKCLGWVALATPVRTAPGEHPNKDEPSFLVVVEES